MIFSLLASRNEDVQDVAASRQKRTENRTAAPGRATFSITRAMAALAIGQGRQWNRSPRSIPLMPHVGCGCTEQDREAKSRARDHGWGQRPRGWLIPISGYAGTHQPHWNMTCHDGNAAVRQRGGLRLR